MRSMGIVQHTPAPFLLGPWSLGPFATAGLRWSTAAYLLGFAAAWLTLRRAARRGGVPGVDQRTLSDGMALLVVSVLVGARVGHALIHDPHGLLNWTGWRQLMDWRRPGMNFNGGLVALFGSGAAFCRARDLNLWAVADLLAAPLTFAMALGRVANWFNGELYGTPTDAPWGVLFAVPPAHLIDGANVPRHPVQLYSAAAAVVLGLVLVVAGRRTRFRARPAGAVTVTFLVGCGLLRFLTECFRQEDVWWGVLHRGQVLALCLPAAGAVLVAARGRRRKADAGLGNGRPARGVTDGKGAVR